MYPSVALAVVAGDSGIAIERNVTVSHGAIGLPKAAQRVPKNNSI